MILLDLLTELDTEIGHMRVILIDSSPVHSKSRREEPIVDECQIVEIEERGHLMP